MGRATEKPLYAAPTDYEDDFGQWSYEQAERLRRKPFDKVDLAKAIEELESVGSEQRHALESAYGVPLMPLLKWAHQPEKRTASRQVTINTQRGTIRRREWRTPSLAAAARAIVAEMYGEAANDAAPETGLERSTFPRDCPWSLEQLRDKSYVPGPHGETTSEPGVTASRKRRAPDI